MTNNTKFGVLNTERNIMVTEYGGPSLFPTAEKAKELKAKMGGEHGDHLQVVKVTPFRY